MEKENGSYMGGENNNCLFFPPFMDREMSSEGDYISCKVKLKLLRLLILLSCSSINSSKVGAE